MMNYTWTVNSTYSINTLEDVIYTVSPFYIKK